MVKPLRVWSWTSTVNIGSDIRSDFDFRTNPLLKMVYNSFSQNYLLVFLPLFHYG